LIEVLGLKAQNIQNKLFFGEDTLDIVYFKKSDELPKTMEVYGEIVNVSSGASCGVFQSSGTLKIKLTKCVKGYPYSFLYVVVPCLTKNDELIGEIVSLNVTALFEDNEECYKPILNKFSSNGIPFYWLNQIERLEFYQQIMVSFPKN
jgi:hypothetical protein